MARTIAEKIRRRMNDNFSENVVAALEAHFGDQGFECNYNILEMTRVTTWNTDTPVDVIAAIRDFLEAYQTGYVDAISSAHEIP